MVWAVWRPLLWGVGTRGCVVSVALVRPPVLPPSASVCGAPQGCAFPCFCCGNRRRWPTGGSAGPCGAGRSQRMVNGGISLPRAAGFSSPGSNRRLGWSPLVPRPPPLGSSTGGDGDEGELSCRSRGDKTSPPSFPQLPERHFSAPSCPSLLTAGCERVAQQQPSAGGCFS